MKTIHLLASVAMLLCTGACSTNNQKAEVATAQVSQVATSDASYGVADTTSFAGGYVETKQEDQSPAPQEPKKLVVTNNGTEQAYPDWNKKLIKTAEVSLETYNNKRFEQQLKQSLLRYGAYISTEEQQEAYGRLENKSTIRVPVDQFDALLNSIVEQDSIRIEKRQVQASDVTAEMYDTRARMEARRKVRERYLQLLQQAHKMDDILQVEGQINSIQEEIEAAGGRLNYLKNQTAYSTIHLSYYTLIGEITKPDPQGDGFFTRAIDGFKAGGWFIVEILLFAIRLWPLILVGTILVVLWKRRRTITIKQ